MKELIISFAIIVLISIQVKAQNYGLGNADPALFTKYKIPDTDLHSLWFKTNFDYSSTKNSNYYRNNYYFSNNYSNSDENLTYNLSPQYYLLKESEDRVLSLNLNATGSYNYSKQVSDGPVSNNNSKTKTNSAELNMALNISYNKYQDAGNMFYTLGSSVLVDMSDYKHDDSNDYNNYSSNNKNQIYTISVGIGWGRVRNVTPIVSAIRFQERLKQVNALNRDLDEKTLEDLAQKFSQVEYYSDIHNRADKYFWQDIEKVLSNDGVSLSGLNQYSNSYLREVLSEVRFIRNEGLETSVSFQLKYNNQYQYQNLNRPMADVAYNYLKEINEQFYTLFNGSLTYNHQLNLNSQLSFRLSLSGGPNLSHNSDNYNLLNHPGIKQAYFFDSGIGYNYELTDRLIATINNSFSLLFQNADIQGKILTNDLSFVLNYFVEDNMSLGISYTFDYTNSKDSYLYFEQEGVNHNISIGFTYYIDRAMIL